MDPQHLRALRDHRVQLVHGINHIPTILDYLVQDNIITEEEEQQVQEKDGPNQIRKLLAILPSKGGRAFQSFCQALERTGHSGLAKRLTCSNDVDRTGQNVIFDPGRSQHSRSHDQNSNAVSSCARDHQTVNKQTRKKGSGEHVFIVHAGEDKDSFVRPLVQTLQDKGIPQEDIFYDELSIGTGEVIRDRIMSALASDSMEVVVIVASKSLLNHKYWPKLELETALRHNKRLYPIWLDDNQDSFKEFSYLVGQYCPTLKQIRAHCVQTSKISEETTAIASEVISMISCSTAQDNGAESKDSHTGDTRGSMTRFVAELPDMAQGSTQSRPSTSPSQLFSESSSTMLSDTVESMGYDQCDAQKAAATVSSGVMSTGREFIEAGPSTSSLQGCNGQSSVQYGPSKSPSTVEDASVDEKFIQKMQSEVRSAPEISGNQYQLHGVGKRQSTSRKPDSPSMSPSRLLDIDLDAAMEIVVASIISDEWRTLLHHLGLSEQELGTLQNKETPEAACEAGLKLWRETRGQEVTIERLVRAVKDTKVKLRNGADVKIKLSIKEKWTDWLNKKADIIFTEEVLNDPQRFDSAMVRFDKLKGSIKDLWEGSVWCLLTFYRWGSVQEFVDGCREGALTELLTEEYVDEQMMAACGGTELYVCVEIHQTDLHKAWNFFHADCNSPDEDRPPSDDWQAETVSAPSSSSPDGELMDIDTHISVKEEPMDFESDLDTAFEIVSKDLWSDWERLARTMGFGQSDVDSIKSWLPDQPYQQCWKLLYRWRDREGQRATLQALMQQLRVAGFHETAEKLDIGDMSDQEEHGASKKSWDDSESSSDSDSDSDGDDNSMKGAAPPSKMKQLKTGKRQVPDPQWTAAKGVKKKKMEEDGDVEMVEQTGVSTSDSTVPAEVATDDLSFMLTPADIKCWQDAMNTHVVSDSRALLEEQYRFNMLLMHFIKDKFYHKHLCHYWNDKGSLPVRLTQFVSYVVTKFGHEHCIKGNLDIELYNGMEQDIQYQLGKLLFKQDAAGVCKLLSFNSLQSCFTNDRLKYVQAWLEPTSDSGSSIVASYYRFKHECIRQYIMAVWVAGTIHKQGETIRANDFLRQCFDIYSKLDTMAYFVAGHMAQNDQVDLFSYQLSRVLFSMDTTDFSVCQKVAICMAETGQVKRFESHTSQFFPGNVIDLTSWPGMSYLGKLAVAHLKETFALTCKLSHEAEILKLLFKSKKNKAEAQLLLSLMKSRHRSVVLYPHYKCLLEGSAALVSQKPCRIDKLYLNNLPLAEHDFSNVLSLLQFVPGLKHLNLQKTSLSISCMSKICDFLSFTPNIEHLVLSKCRIPNDSFLTLTEHLQCLKKLKHLNLSQTGMTNEGVNIFAHHLSSWKAIEVVDLRKNKVGKDELMNLCEVMTDMDNIPQLILGSQTSSYRFLVGVANSRGNRLIISTGDSGVVTLVSQLNSQVYRVELSHQSKQLYLVQADEGEKKHITFDLTCSGNITENIQALFAVLPVGHRVQQADVEELELCGSLIGDEEVALLAEMFCYLPSLKYLDLSDNMITCSGVSAVAAHISHIQQLEWLDLGANNIREVGVAAMNEMLVNLEKLKYLNITMNGFVSTSVDPRKSLLLTLSNMENLSDVNLSTEMSSYLYLLDVYNKKGNRLTIRTGDADVVSLVDQVFSQVYRVELSCWGKVLYSVQAEEGENPHRMTLDLRCAGNIFENIQALSAALPVGHRVQQADLEELMLGSSSIGDEGVRLLATMFCYLPSLKHLDLSFNMLTSTGARAVTAYISHLQQLEKLNLSGIILSHDPNWVYQYYHTVYPVHVYTDMKKKSLLLTLSKMEHLSEVNLSTEMSSYLYLLDVYNKKGNRLTIRTGDADVVSLVDQVFSQVYRVELSWRGKVVYLVQAEEDGNPHRMTLNLTDLICTGFVAENRLQALSAALPVGHRVQQADVEKLKLGGSLNGDEEVRLLAAMFCYLPSLKHLDMSNNMITSSGASAVAAHISYLQQLEWLDLSGNDIGEVGVMAVNGMLVNLEKLKYVNFNMNGATTNMTASLLLTLSNMEHLSEVNLSTEISSYLYLLDVYNKKGNRLTIRTGDADVVSLVDQVFSQVYRVELSCWGKVLYSVQAEEGENPHRMTLDLTCAGDITANIQALSVVLPVGHRVQQADVEELKLGGSDIGDEGVRLLAEMFCYLPSLKHLDLSHNVITSSGARAVAAHISHLQQLEWLDFRFHSIGDDGFIALADRFCFIPKLKYLDLCHNWTTFTINSDRAIIAMNEKLPYLRQLKFLKMDTKSLNYSTKKSLLTTLSNMQHLSEVHVSYKWDLHVSDEVEHCLFVNNCNGSLLTIRTYDTEVVSLVTQLFTQVQL